jgi:hypothetical protein
LFVPHSRLALAAILCLAACHRSPSPAIDRDFSSLIPSSAVLIAGIDLAQLRSSPLYPNLPPAVKSALDPLRDASYAIVASDGSRFLIAARGRLEGAKTVTPNLAVMGSPDLVDSAIAQHRNGSTGAAPLLARAPAGPLWVVADGSAQVPLAGNAANLNRLLHFTQYTTATATFDARPILKLAGTCGSEENARRVEETVRAVVSLGQRLQSSPAVEIRRDGVTVTVKLELNPADVPRWF